MGEWLRYNLLLRAFILRNFVADFIRLKLNFIYKNRFLSHPSGAVMLSLGFGLES